MPKVTQLVVAVLEFELGFSVPLTPSLRLDLEPQKPGSHSDPVTYPVAGYMSPVSCSARVFRLLSVMIELGWRSGLQLHMKK